MPQRTGDMLGPSPYTGEQGEIWALNHPLTHEDWNPSESYKLVYLNGQFHMSEDEDYEQLARNAGAGPDYKGPMAIGKVHIDYGKAEFEVATNLHAKGIERVLQLVCQKQGWQWGGMTDMAGQTLSDTHVSSIFFKQEGSLLKFAHSPSSLDTIDGAIHIKGQNAHVYPYRPLSALHEWAKDSHMTLYAGDNVIKVVEDLEEKNVYSPEWNNPEDHFLRKDPEDDTNPSGPYECSDCHKEFPSMNALIDHRKNDEDEWGDVENKTPVLEYNDPDNYPDMDASVPSRFIERPDLVYGSMPLPGPIPFILDIKKDRIEVGLPGQTKDSFGAHYTPGQIVRGVYNPGGKLEIESLSDVSISVSHLLELWSYSQINMPIRSVWLDVGGGRKPERIAHQESIWE